jgi:hypothetical protein
MTVVSQALPVLLCLASGPAAPRPPNFFFGSYSLMSPEDLALELLERGTETASPLERLEHLSRGLLGAPYLRSPLGEGAGVDKDPRFRVDAFDCTTFVETVLALSGCDRLEHVPTVLDGIRYSDGSQAFDSRRHLVISQWIPGLQEAGWLEDITEQIGGKDAQSVQLHLNPKRWNDRRVARNLPLPKGRVPFGSYRLPYLSMATVRAHMAEIPPNTIINVVRRPRWTSPDLVTHQGLVLIEPTRGLRVVRHASPVFGRVVDEPLEAMATRYQRPRPWPVIGLNFQRILPRKACGCETTP